MSRSVSDAADRVTITDLVTEVRDTGFYLGHYAPKWSSEPRVFIPRSLIMDSDTDLDEVTQGEEITVEILPLESPRLGLIE